MDREASLSNVLRGVILLLAVACIGTVGFMVLEDFSFLDALYMTIITISTVGYGEVRALELDGKLFVIALIVAGIMVVGYTLTALGRAIVEGSLRRMVGRKRMMREIESMHGHIIVCGYGRVGKTICEELSAEKVPFVVIDRDVDQAESLTAKGFKVVLGDATEDDTLMAAGIMNARGLVSVASRDVDNLYITLSAREMSRPQNPGLHIVSRASDQRELRKIRLAGADQVISPYAIGGVRIAQALLRPSVYEVTDLLTHSGAMELSLENVRLHESSPLVGRALRDTTIRQEFNIIIIGVKSPDGSHAFNPGPEYVLEDGDELIVLGRPDQIERFTANLN